MFNKGASNFREAMRIGSEIYHHLKNVIKSKYGLDACNVGDEGGFAPNIQDNMEGLELLKVAIEKAGYTGRVKIGMDVAASEFYQDGKYNLDFKSKEPNPSLLVIWAFFFVANNRIKQIHWLIILNLKVTPDELANIYKDMINKYPVVSIEDAFEQDDWNAWVKFQSEIQIQLVGDDLTVTNIERIKQAVDKKACNCLLLKVNQIGSVWESIQSCKLAQSNGWGVMVSHRSGETEDSFIADLVVGLGTGQVSI